MPRAKPFTGSEVSERQKIASPFKTVVPSRDTLSDREAALFRKQVLIEKSEDVHRRAFTPRTFRALAEWAAIPPSRRAECLKAINGWMQWYKLSLLAQAQERPARIVAALKRVLSAKELNAALEDLPMGLRQELGCGTSSQIRARARKRIAYWQRHVRASRPSGKAWARRNLFQAIEAIGIKFSPQKFQSDEGRSDNERSLRQWTAELLRKAGIEIPDEKKNRRKVTGQSARGKKSPG